MFGGIIIHSKVNLVYLKILATLFVIMVTVNISKTKNMAYRCRDVGTYSVDVFKFLFMFL